MGAITSAFSNSSTIKYSSLAELNKNIPVRTNISSNVQDKNNIIILCDCCNEKKNDFYFFLDCGHLNHQKCLIQLKNERDQIIKYACRSCHKQNMDQNLSNNNNNQDNQTSMEQQNEIRKTKILSKPNQQKIISRQHQQNLQFQETPTPIN